MHSCRLAIEYRKGITVLNGAVSEWWERERDGRGVGLGKLAFKWNSLLFHLSKEAANFQRHQFTVRFKYVWQCTLSLPSTPFLSPPSILHPRRSPWQGSLRWFWHAHTLHTDQQSARVAPSDRGGAVCGVQIKIPLWRLGNSIIFHLLHGHASWHWQLVPLVVVVAVVNN